MIKSVAPLGKKLQIVLENGRSFTIQPKSWQVGFDDIQIAPDRRTAGWVLGYDVIATDSEGRHPWIVNHDVAGALMIWRAGRISHTFNLDFGAISWSFRDNGNKVAAQTGPLHFDTEQQCDLYDTMTGRPLKSWNTEMKTNPPDWAKGLVADP